MGVIEDQIAVLKQEQDLVLKELRACNDQKRATLNDSDRVRLEEQEKQFKENYEELNKKIERLRNGSLPELTPEVLNRFKAELRNAWEADLHWLDYDKQENKLHTLVRVKKQEAVLLFIQCRIKMKADLYIKRIRKRVFDDGRMRPFIEDFSSEGVVDPQRFIERWRDSLKIPPADSGLEKGNQQVIQNLQQAVTHGQTLCLEIRIEQVSDDFLGWFLDKFWKPLVEATLHSKQGINVVVILTSEDALPKRCILQELFCQSAKFDACKYLEIKLCNWPQQDIESWMNSYLNATLHQRHLPLQNAQALAQQVYRHSNKGTPLHAYNLILGDMLTQVIDRLPGRCDASN